MRPPDAFSVAPVSEELPFLSSLILISTSFNSENLVLKSSTLVSDTSDNKLSKTLV